MKKICPYEDYKTIQKKAEGFIERILGGAYYFECHMKIKPTIFMSKDVLAIIAQGARDAIINYNDKESMIICGYNLELVLGQNKLYLGYQLSEPRW